MQRFKTMEIGGKIVMEFNLSEKRKELREGCAMLKRSEILDEIEEQDKEFIKIIEEKILTNWKGQNKFIDWLNKKIGEDLK